MNDYATHDAVGLAALVRSGEITPAELVDASLDAIRRVDSKLHCMVHDLDEHARRQATGELPDGPLRGVPYVVKDLSAPMKGLPFECGCRFLSGYTATYDAEVITRLRKAGVVFVGKSKTPEFGIMGTTEPLYGGPAHNPWNLDHSTGGSSGGSGAIVAAGGVPGALGGDGGGSLRIPGSANGVLGLKGTRGRIPVGPGKGEGWGGFVQLGTITRTVRDLALFTDLMSGPMPGDPYNAPPLARPLSEEVGVAPGTLRIAMTTDSLMGHGTHPACVKATEDAAALLEELGHTVERVHPPIDRDSLVHAYFVQVASSVAADVAAAASWLGRSPKSEDLEPVTRYLMQLGRSLSAVDLHQSRDTCHRLSRTLGTFFGTYDLLLTPTTAHPPVKLGTLALKPWERAGLKFIGAVPGRLALKAGLAALGSDALDKTPNTQLFNMSGFPAMSVPLSHAPNGLPVGVQLGAGWGQEATLIRIASQLEEARPWKDRKPPVYA